ncbi:hypothetical protein [Legionella hackeliae]|nr:hypothetical protein [Legionella hackeliae]KTD13154.1 hypothetical protein Lhac_1023 [Legionella hackeliae]STX48305.1 Uncharacterised protein [Legionella hackeliae]
MPLQENSICIRIWHLARNKQHKVMGYVTDGHISIEVNKDGKRDYMSFYPDILAPKKEPTFWAKWAKRLGLLSVDKTKGMMMLIQSGEIYPNVNEILTASISVFSLWSSFSSSASTAVDSIQEVFKSNKSGNLKIAKINEIIDNNQPSILAFWKRDQYNKFESMRAEANIIVGVSEFLKGNYSVTTLSRLLHAYESDLPTSKKVAMEKFIKLLSVKHNEHKKAYEHELETMTRPGHYASLRKELGVSSEKTAKKGAKVEETNTDIIDVGEEPVETITPPPQEEHNCSTPYKRAGC